MSGDGRGGVGEIVKVSLCVSAGDGGSESAKVK